MDASPHPPPAMLSGLAHMGADSSIVRTFSCDSHELPGLRSSVLRSFPVGIILRGRTKERLRGGRVRSEGKQEEEALGLAGVSVVGGSNWRV